MILFYYQNSDNDTYWNIYHRPKTVIHYCILLWCYFTIKTMLIMIKIPCGYRPTDILNNWPTDWQTTRLTLLQVVSRTANILRCELNIWFFVITWLQNEYTHNMCTIPKELLEEELDRFLFEWTTSPNRFEEKQPWLF